MKIKTSELTGAALDWAVARCAGYRLDLVPEDSYTPSTDWSQGGPIIERECMDLLCLEGGDDGWQADRYLHTEKVEAYGPTPLIAAMRCYVASKLGDTIDIPEELT
jgi:hypothetical protein